MMETYEEQRKNRLDEVVFDYIQDDDATPETFYRDLKDVLISNRKYYEEQIMRIDKISNLCGFDGEPLLDFGLERYSQYTEEEIDAMCSEADRKSKEEINLEIQANSPFNDGYTQEFYKEQLKNLKDSKDIAHSDCYWDTDRNR